METHYDLDRFVKAQDAVYDNVLAELSQGRKASHWMWYVFPQLLGLGHSQTSQFYGLNGRDEATAYLAHPVLGKRLIQCTKLAIKHCADGAEAVFGGVDALKFHSSITLFSRVKGASPVFESALFGFFGGIGDQQTLRMLRIAFIESLDS
ncbi:MAG TPA: DUF1810 domain-containing protein [Rhodobacteraceae bacterium]|nr:DUF1810 domain-containing protein [Paracoccaceae bacterium]